MDREQLMEFISEEYSVYGDYPWMKSPNYVVYRHRSNRKWFAIIMDISESKLGLEGGVCITCGKVRQIFDAGEWFYIEKDTPHAIEPAEDKTYSLLSICIPDSYPVSVKAEEDTDAEQLKQ